MSSRPDGHGHARWMLLLIICVATVTALAGNGSKLPLDTHEVFVARTAEEMIARGSFIVPYLNDQPRVKKPPLAYWLVMAADSVNGSDGVVGEWEARAPSIAGGIALVVLTFALGCVLLHPMTAMLGALLLASSSGYVYYTHSARPEMLYAALCTAGLLGLARANPQLSPASSSSQRTTAAWLGWAAFGVAVLAKGPQLPLLLVVGWVVCMAVNRREVRGTIHPLAGLLIVAAISAWWFIAVGVRVPTLGNTLERETLTRIFNFDKEPAALYLDPYYLYRTAALFLPWALLYPGLIGLPIFRQFKRTLGLRVLWWVTIIPLIALHLSLGRRWYYMLPVMAPAALIMAHIGLTIGRMLVEIGKERLWQWIMLIHVAALMAGLIIYQNMDHALQAPPMLAVSAVMVAGIAAIAFILEAVGRARVVERSFAATLIMGALFFAASTFEGSLWNRARFDRRAFALEAARLVPKGAFLVSWRNDWEIEQYYAHRTIPAFVQHEHLQAELAGHREAFLLVDARYVPDMPQFVIDGPVILELHLVDDDDEDDVLQLRRIAQ